MYLYLLLGICALASAAVGVEENEIQRQPLTNTLTDHLRYRRAFDMRKIKDKVTMIQSKLKKSVTPALRHMFDRLNETVGKLDGTAENVEKLGELVTKVDDNWKELTGSDAIAISKSVVDIVGTVAAFLPPPVGTIASTIFGIVGGLLGIFGGEAGTQKSMSDIVREVMVKELHDQYINQMNDNIEGAVSYMQMTKVFLNEYIGGNVSSDDFNFMFTYFNHLKGLELKGQLANLIARLAKNRKSDIAEDTIKLVEKYVMLTSMVELLMHSMKSILEENLKHTKSVPAVAAIIQEGRFATKRHLMFLWNPKVENGVAAAHYEPEKYPTVEKMLIALNVSAPLTDGCYKMVNNHWKKGVHIWNDAGGLETYDSTKIDDDIFQFNNTIKRGTYDIRNKGELLCGGETQYGFMFHRQSQCSRPSICSSFSCPKKPFRIYPFSDVKDGYMLVHALKPTKPLYLQSYDSKFNRAATDGFVTPAEGENPWEKHGDNPSYVWLLTKVVCG